MAVGASGDMRAIYAWTEVDDSGAEGVIAVMHPAMGHALILLQHRRPDIADGMRPFAEAHAARTGHRVRLVRFERAEDLAEITGGEDRPGAGPQR